MWYYMHSRWIRREGLHREIYPGQFQRVPTGRFTAIQHRDSFIVTP